MQLLLEAGAKVNASNNVRARPRARSAARNPSPPRRATLPRCAHLTERLASPRRAQAGDRPWHWADAMAHTAVQALLESHGAETEFGQVIVPEHVDKVKNFYACDEGPKHPLPSQEYLDWRAAMDKAREDEKANTIPGMYVD